MSINDLVIRGSTSISLHERFTSLRRSGGPSSQGQSNNDNLNDSGYNRNAYAEDTSPGPALRGPAGAPNYTPIAKVESYDRGDSYRNGGVGRSAPPPPLYDERYNPEQVSYLLYNIAANIRDSTFEPLPPLVNVFLAFLLWLIN